MYGTRVRCFLTNFTNSWRAAHFLVLPFETALVILELVLLCVGNGVVCREKADHGIAEEDIYAGTDTSLGCSTAAIVDSPTLCNCGEKMCYYGFDKISINNITSFLPN